MTTYVITCADCDASWTSPEWEPCIECNSPNVEINDADDDEDGEGDGE